MSKLCFRVNKTRKIARRKLSGRRKDSFWLLLNKLRDSKRKKRRG